METTIAVSASDEDVLTHAEVFAEMAERVVAGAVKPPLPRDAKALLAAIETGLRTRVAKAPTPEELDALVAAALVAKPWC